MTGARFTSPSAQSKMAVLARQSAKSTIREEYEGFLQYLGKSVKTKEITESSFLIGGSGARGSFFYKVYFREFKGVNTLYILSLDYPTDDGKYKSAVEGILASFKLTDIASK